MNFTNLYMKCLSIFWRFSAIMSLNKFLPFLPLFFWDPKTTPIISVNVSRSLLRLASPLFHSFLLFFSDWVMPNGLSSTSQILSSAWSNLMLMLSFSFYCFLQLWKFCLVLFNIIIISMSFLNFSFCSDTIFLLLLNCPSVF